MSEERYKLIKENVYTRCHIAEYTGIGLSCPDKEEIELIDYVEELKDQLQQKENIIKEVIEELRIYEEQSNDGTTNELDNYVFVQRLKKVLDKEVN